MKELEVLNKLVSIRSDESQKEILNYIEDKLKNSVEEILYVANKENNNLNMLVGINTKLKDIEPIVLSGHIDTVIADEKSYNTNPYELVVINDRAYGLGVIDMKCFTASIIDLIKVLRKYDYPIVVALTCDEETDFYGINNVIKKMKELNIKPKFTIIGEPTSLEIKSASNGCFEYKVEVYGKRCHSSKPSEGVNSICVLAKLVTYIEMLANEYDDLTMSCNLINGGSAINIVADYASLGFDIRTSNVDNYNEVVNLIEKEINNLEIEYKCKIDFTNTLKIPPLVIKKESIIKELSISLNLNVSKFDGGCEAGYYSEYSGDAILFGVGDLLLAHKPNEYMIVKDYYIYNELLINMLDKLKTILQSE